MTLPTGATALYLLSQTLVHMRSTLAQLQKAQDIDPRFADTTARATGLLTQLQELEAELVAAVKVSRETKEEEHGKG